MRYKHTKEELEEAVKKSLAIAGVCRELNMKACGGNYKTLHAKFKEWEIDTSHFTGQAWSANRKIAERQLHANTILVRDRHNGRREQAYMLRKSLIEVGIPELCSQCQMGPVWCGEPMVLEVDHIDGDPLNNLQNNLRFLCPNCHSQTATSGVKNRKRT